MILHSLKQIWRSLWRYKSFTIINFLGLSIGVAAIAVLYLVAGYEKNFDKLHSDSDQLFRVVSERETNGKKDYSANVPYPTAKFFRSEFSDALATEINFDRERNIKIGNASAFTEKNILFADSLFFEVMDFGRIKNFWISGNQAKALDAPNKVILTQSTARRYFGNVDPIGKLVKLDNKIDLEVTGLVRDVPAATHL
ncbi:MAG: ABC transporter permease, partial [Flavisolibacter sp.]